MTLTESIVEDAALEWFGELGYAVGHGPHLAPGEPAAERNRSAAEMDEVNSVGEVLLVDFSDVGLNDWLAVNQFTVIEGQLPLRV